MDEQFRAVVEKPGIGVAALAQGARVLRANATMQEMFGYSEGEMRNMVLSALTHPDDVMSDSEAFQNVCAGCLDRYQIEKRYYRKDEQLLWGRFTATSIKIGRASCR